MTRIDDALLAQIAGTIADVGRRAILPRFKALAAHEIDLKGPDDYVTAADLEAEALLTPALLAALPGSKVVGEEAVSKDKTVLDALAGDDPVWIVDPVDGTYNFAKGQAPFCTIVALVRRGAPIAGWIHAPLTGDTLTARAGQGAAFNGEPARVSPDAPQAGAFYAKAARAKAKDDGRYTLVDERCGGAAYLDLARGRFGFACFSRTLPWDHAAGALAAAEMGCAVGFLPERAPYDARRHVGPFLIAASEARFAAMARLFD
ncbi:MAG: inositol monophosphatase [Azospirillum sp.]|nr:inositol monophosphatase [Azospirillum sp.]